MKKPIIKILQQAGMEVGLMFYPNSLLIFGNEIQSYEIRKGVISFSEPTIIYQYPNGMISNKLIKGFVDPDKVYLEDGSWFYIEEWKKKWEFEIINMKYPNRGVQGVQFKPPIQTGIVLDSDLPQGQ